ncbi:retinol dehydrogenase 13-like [Culicoides brevitarsis]|uniref:retinol dehydrogenase 13-like n=1 Tax=Culicoides brevitarsis TaxID=469753 RepID=UPI00307B3044
MFSALRSKPVVLCSTIAAGAGVTFLTKDYFQGTAFTNPVRADGKIVVITGANTGIGKETAKELAKRGAHVYMACRSMKRCEAARDEILLASKNPNVHCRECDLASFASIKEFAKKFKEEQPKLDILINNGGVMRCPRMFTREGIELQIGVNHFGHFLLTTLLLDQLKKAAPSRVVVVSSLAHERGHLQVDDLNSDKHYDSGAAYNQSKLANLLFTRSLSQRLAGSGVTVNALHPGVVNTELGRHMGMFSSFLGKIFVKPFLWPFFKEPIAGAQTTLYVALDPDLEKITGKYFSDCALKTPAAQAMDDKMAEWLWQVSEKWVKLDKIPAAS